MNALARLGIAATLFAVTAAGFEPAAAAEKVTVGAFISDIQHLDLESHSFSADVYLWFRWRNPDLDPSETFEFMNPYELWGHTHRKTYEKPQKLPGGELYQVVRVQGRFTSKFDLSRFPFDRQTLAIDFEENRSDAEEIVYFADPEGVAIRPGMSLPGFVLGAPTLEVRRATYPTRFGDTREPASGTAVAGVRIALPIARPTFPSAVKFLLPILCVVFCAALMFLFNPSYVDARVGIGITALLTIVALQITLNEDLPEIDYLVLVDKIYLGAYLYVIAGLGVVVKTTWMLEKRKGEIEAALRVDRLSLKVLSLLFFGATGILLVSALT